MKFGNRIFNTAIGFAIALSFAVSFQINPAFAIPKLTNCSTFTSPQMSNFGYSIELNAGQTLTINGSDFSFGLSSIRPSRFFVKHTYTAKVDGTIVSVNPLKSSTITVQCVDAVAGDPTTEQIKETLSGLLSNQLSSQLGQSIGDAVAGGLGDGTSNPFISENAFSISSRGLASLAAGTSSKKTLSAQVKEQVYGADVNFDNVPEQSPWNVWASGRYAYFDGDTFDGGVGTVNAGIDYGFNENFLLGAVIGYGRADIDVGATGTLETRSYTLGTYFGAKLGGTIMADGFVAYTKSDYDVASGGTTGQFDANRLSTGINLYGSIVMDKFTVQPGISFIYGSEKQDAYIDSTATAVAGQTIKSGRISVGPKIIFNAIETNSGSISPWIAARFEHNFSNTNSAANTGAPDLGNNNSGRLSAGFSSDFGAGTFSLSGDVGGLGTGDYISYGGTAKIRIPLQ
ncbi:autotransporter outer membrane beta-barrel domain-containing protein [Ahrensia sp. AH-315-G08]|nr:autotransporter outer membrane beta-barrel domain-containing protein [Ahrensia sp. AH-315-G08]